MNADFREPQGVNFRCATLVHAKDLSASLCKVLSFLQADAPYAKLSKYRDWWEHDGLHFPAGSADFHLLFQVFESPRALLEAMPGDEYVRIGVAPDDFSWYLRFFVDWDDNDADLEGDFDLTLPKGLDDRFRAEVVPALPVALVEEPSEGYYKRIKQ